MIKSIKKTLETRAKIAQTRRELASLSDKELADIGISRHDIETVARQSVVN